MLRRALFTVVFVVLAMTWGGSADAQTFANIPALSFTKPFGGANPLPQTLTVGSTGAAFTYSVATTTTTGGSWLQVSPAGGGCCTTPSS